MTDVLLIEKQSPLTWLKINRPNVLNSLNTELLYAIKNACCELKEDKNTRVVAIIASGNKAFSAGADLTERKGMTESQVVDYLNLIQSTMLAIESLPQPVIAAMNGSAFGGGLELALACDLRVALDSISMRLTEVKLGIIPGAGGTQRLSRLIGKSKAKEMILTARAFTAQEALNVGLVHKVVANSEANDASFHPELSKQVFEWAREIAQAAPLALKQAKWAIDNGYDRDLQSGLALETKAYLQLLTTKDRLEGLKAFAEKRQPTYLGE
jgi:enoyl-CoA hydratase/carnithine racemase